MEEDTYGTREDHVYALRILELVNRCHACAKEHGFWDEYSGPRNTTYLPGLGYGLGGAILEKVKVNEGRPHMHGKKA